MDGDTVEPRSSRRTVALVAAAVVVVAAVTVAISAVARGGDDALGEGDFVGIWRSGSGVYVQFNDDGTLTASWTIENLALGDVETGTWSLKGTEFTWTADEYNPGCNGHQVAAYQVERVDENSVKWTPAEDDCSGRANDLRRSVMRRYDR